VRILKLAAVLLVISWSLVAVADNRILGKPGPKQTNSRTYLEKFQKLTPNLANGRVQYEVCALCHTPEGWGSPSGRYPQIAGQYFEVIVKQMEDIRNGNRDNPTMYPFSQFDNSRQGLQNMVDVAAYISQLPMSANNAYGPGRDLTLGERLYKDNCVKCHGKNGEGRADKYYPRIHGQHYKYLLRQLRWIKNKKRRNADLKMQRQINGFKDSDLRAIADYTSRLKPDTNLIAKDHRWRNDDFRGGFNHAQERDRRSGRP